MNQKTAEQRAGLESHPNTDRLNLWLSDVIQDPHLRKEAQRLNYQGTFETAFQQFLHHCEKTLERSLRGHHPCSRIQC